MPDHVAIAETEIEALPGEVWSALTDPTQIAKYMFGSQVETDWKEGSPIVWRGEYRREKVRGQGGDPRDRSTEAAQDDALQPAERRGGCAQELPHSSLRTRGGRSRNTRQAESGQQPNGRASGALKRDLGEDVVRSEGDCRKPIGAERQSRTFFRRGDRGHAESS